MPRTEADAEVAPWWEESSPASDRKRSRRNLLAWLAAAGVTFVIFEMTSDSSLALAVGCLKFAWHDFRTASRVKRLDPDRARGRVCAWFYRAWGLLKVSLIAFLLMFILLFVGAQLDQLGVRQIVRKVTTALLLAFVGFGLSMTISALALLPALRHGAKVWVGTRVNRVKVLLLANVITLFLLSCIVLIMVPLSFGEPAAPWAGPVLGLCLGIGIPVGGALAIMIAMEYLTRRVVASEPDQDWLAEPALDGPFPESDPYRAGDARHGFVTKPS